MHQTPSDQLKCYFRAVIDSVVRHNVVKLKRKPQLRTTIVSKTMHADCVMISMFNPTCLYCLIICLNLLLKLGFEFRKLYQVSVVSKLMQDKAMVNETEAVFSNSFVCMKQP